MQKTSSFNELEGWSKDALNWLYDDYFGARQDTLWRENARRTLPALMTWLQPRPVTAETGA